MAKTVVTRAEAPLEAEPPAKAKLSPEEIQALLATTKVNRSGKRRVLKRAAVFVPIGVIEAVLHVLAGAVASTIVGVLLTLGAIAWIAWPMFKQGDWE